MLRFMGYEREALRATQTYRHQHGRRGAIIQNTQHDLHAVTHPLLPTRAAPGQLSFVEIQKAYLVGSSGKAVLHLESQSHSMSPTLHNTASSLGSRTPRAPETDQVDADVRATLAHADFGGASVTIPLKRDIMSQTRRATPEAKASGP